MQVILSGKSIDSKEEQPLNVEPTTNSDFFMMEQVLIYVT